MLKISIFLFYFELPISRLQTKQQEYVVNVLKSAKGNLQRKIPKIIILINF